MTSGKVDVRDIIYDATGVFARYRAKSFKNGLLDHELVEILDSSECISQHFFRYFVDAEDSVQIGPLEPTFDIRHAGVVMAVAVYESTAECSPRRAGRLSIPARKSSAITEPYTLAASSFVGVPAGGKTFFFSSGSTPTSLASG